MGADRQQALADRPVAVAERPLDDRVLGQERLQLAPQGDAFQQGARLVGARRAVGEGGVHVEVGVDEGRRHQAAGGVDDLPRLALQLRAEVGDALALDGDVDALPAVGQGGAADHQIEHQRSSLRNGTRRAAGARALRDSTAMATMVSTKGIIRKT